MAITVPGITMSTVSQSQQKFLANKLIQRSRLRLVALGVCDPMEMEKGSGDTAYMVRFKRMNLPTASLTEGTDPTQSTIATEQVTVQLDQWGDVLAVSDKSRLTTFHPLVEQAIKLLSDNAQRVIDREVQVVFLAGTNVQYFDGSAVTARASLTTAHKITDTVILKGVVTLADAGASPRGGPYDTSVSGAGGGGSSMSGTGTQGVRSEGGGSINGSMNYVALAGPQVMADIVNASIGTGKWISAAVYGGQAKSLYNYEVGTYLNVRWIETNFIPKFTLLGDTTEANVSGTDFGTNTPVVTAVATGGFLTASTTYFYKVVRKDLTRGFAENISIAHSTASAAGVGVNSFTFNFAGLTAGYVYDLYFDATQAGGTNADSNLKLVTANIAVGTTITVTAIATGVTPPASVVLAAGTGITIHPIYILAEEAVSFVTLQGLQVLISGNTPTTDNPLLLRQTIGYKFMGKAVIKDQTRLLRIEVYSAF